MAGDVLDKLKRAAQEHFEEGFVVVVGSGLSAALGIPGMRALADHLRVTVPSRIDAALADLWTRIDARLDDKGLEGALAAEHPPPALEDVIVAATADLVLRHELGIATKAVSEKQTLPLGRLFEKVHIPGCAMHVVTTNYDRLVELAAELSGLVVDTMFDGSVVGKLDPERTRRRFAYGCEKRKTGCKIEYKPHVRVFKPHGSLDWFERDSTPIRCTIPVDGARLIVTPGAGKYRKGYEKAFEEHRNAANHEIERASRYVILGYGFNDDHLETRLREQIASGKKALYLTHSLTENGRKLVSEHANVLAMTCEDRNTRVRGQGFDDVITAKALWDLDQFVTEVFPS